MLFRQLMDRESCTYTYVLADEETLEAVIIDPVLEMVDRDVALIREWGVTLKYAINTHVHADHITGTGLLKHILPGLKSVLGAVGNGDSKADVKVNQGDVLAFGKHRLYPVSTPGHTAGCHSFVLDDNECVFTGDTVLIRGCGRTDFQEGSPEALYNSVHTQIFTLPDSCVLYPAHDYRGRMHSTVGEEKAHNPRLTKSPEEFKAIMDGLGLSYPKKIDISLPANKVCGLHELPTDWQERIDSKSPEKSIAAIRAAKGEENDIGNGTTASSCKATASWPTACTNTTDFSDTGFYIEGDMLKEELDASPYLNNLDAAIPPPKTWVSLLDPDNFPPDQTVYDVKTDVEKAGISFHSIPCSPSHPSDTFCSSLVTTLSSIPKPAVIQCKSGLRAQAAVAMYRIAHSQDSRMLPLLEMAFELKARASRGAGCGKASGCG